MLEYLIIFLVFVFGLSVDAAVGGGGGFLIVPVLILLGLDPVTTVASLGLAYIGGLTGGVIKLRRTDHFVLGRQNVPYMILAGLGGITGIHVAIGLDPELLKKFIAISLLVMLALWLGTQKRTITKTFSLHPIVYAPMFFFIGAYYAFAGSGGGLLMTFALFWLMKTTNLKDVIASRLIIGLVINFCFVPFAIFYGRIDWLVSIIGFISALIGGYIGVHYFVKIPEKILKIVFSIVTLVSIGVMLFV